jgi:hypothetical protein
VAMLGKQGWKFQTDTNSLVTRLFKARYFPNGDFMSSRHGANAKVKDIIEPMTKVWNISLISTLFSLSYCPNYFEYSSPTFGG